MVDAKVFRLPSFVGKGCSHVHPRQLQLFGESDATYPRVVMVDPEAYHQHDFLVSVTRNAVNFVVDLRNVPIFRDPDYSHRFVMTYFYRYNITYVEAARLKQIRFNDEVTVSDRLKREFSIPSLGHSFFSLVLFDAGVIKGGLLSEFRGLLARTYPNIIEVNPRSVGF